MPLNLSNHILRKHQAEPARQFFGDFYQPNEFAAKHSVLAIMAVYADLQAHGLVESRTPTTVLGQAVISYKISASGRTAEVGSELTEEPVDHSGPPIE